MLRNSKRKKKLLCEKAKLQLEHGTNPSPSTRYISISLPVSRRPIISTNLLNCLTLIEWHIVINSTQFPLYSLWLNDKQRTADRAARAAGTIYRVAAGTESFDLDINKQALPSTDDDSDIDHNNDDNDSTSRKLSAGNDNGVMRFPL